jgi:hypothetical protein
VPAGTGWQRYRINHLESPSRGKKLFTFEDSFCPQNDSDLVTSRIVKFTIWLTLLDSALPSRSRVADAGVRPNRAPVEYRKIRLSDPAWQQIKQKMGSTAELLLQKINRMDGRHLRRHSFVIAPGQLVDPLDCSPFPSWLGGAANWPKMVLVSQRVQAFGAYEKGRLVRWGPVSTGVPKNPTPANLYYTSWKSRRKVSSLNRTWVMPWYINLHTSMGVAFHQYAMPGKPDSHGCIRLLQEDAVWMYRWTDQWVPARDFVTAEVFGTPVIVFGEYRYDRPAPWTLLPDDPAATLVSEVEIGERLNLYQAVIDQRARHRAEYFTSRAGSVRDAEAEPVNQ